MTPRDFRILVEAKVKERDQYWEFLDALNGTVCSVIASVNGAKNAKPVDLMITRRETEKKPVTSIEEIDQTFKAWAAMTRPRGR